MKDFKQKYRIKEYNGMFSIQIYGCEIKGMLWMERKEWRWMPTNMQGGALGSVHGFDVPSRSLRTLEEAKQQIRLWLKDPVYHEV